MKQVKTMLLGICLVLGGIFCGMWEEYNSGILAMLSLLSVPLFFAGLTVTVVGYFKKD